MAEVIGVVSAGFGIAAFGHQIAGSVRRLRETRNFIQNKAPDEVDHLANRLEFLRQTLLSLESFDGHQIVDTAIAHCQNVYSGVDHAVDNIVVRLSKIETSNLIAVRKSGGIKDDIVAAGNKVDYIINELNLALTRDLHQIVSENIRGTAALLALGHAQQTVASRCRETEEQIIPSHGSLPSSTTALSQSCVLTSPIVPRRMKTRRCIDKRCHCSCHLTYRVSNRFWGFEYTPLSIFLKPCDNPRCTGRHYRWNMRVALTRYGLPLAITAGLEFISAAGSYSLKPGLTAQHVVKYTSPGFQTLWLFSKHLITVTEAKKRLLDVHRSDPSMRYHVNPAGYGYVQELIRSYDLIKQADFLALFTLLVSDLDIRLENQCQDFLHLCTRAMLLRGDGDYLLDMILTNGFDPGTIHSPVFEKWETIYDFCSLFSEDPFLLNWLAKLSNADPGFGGMTNLHDAVLTTSKEVVESSVTRSPALLNERNFLGQTPLHLAVSDVNLVKILVRAGHDIDALDRHGRTPLMYAAALASADTVQFLIGQGANPLIEEKYMFNSRNFMSYAARRGKWDLMLEALEAVKQGCDTPTYQHLVRWSIQLVLERYDGISTAAEPARTDRIRYFTKLVNCCEDVNFIDSVTGETMLHKVKFSEEAEALFRQGFTKFDHWSRQGQLPIHTFRLSDEADSMINLFIQHGMTVNVPDTKGRTILFRLFERLLSFAKYPRSISINLSAVRRCLANGVDIFASDTCRCPCATAGCSMASLIGINWETDEWIDTVSGFIWGTEFLFIIDECCGPELMKKFLLSLLRRKCFDDLQMAHVCCQRKGWPAARSGSFQLSGLKNLLVNGSDYTSPLDQKKKELEQKTLSNLWSEWVLIPKSNYERLRRSCLKETRGPEPAASNNININGRIRYWPGQWQATVNENLDLMECTYVPDPDRPWRGLARNLQRYADWLEAEYSSLQGSAASESQTDAWYTRRVAWLQEMVQAEEIKRAGFKWKPREKKNEPQLGGFDG
ncbi:hypothetical protein BJX64DRAFT_206727 [Aspergillus heterothallicus]